VNCYANVARQFVVGISSILEFCYQLGECQCSVICYGVCSNCWNLPSLVVVG
jgi:hypothetical protein